MRLKSLLPVLILVGIAISIAVFVGYVDQHNDEVWAALLLIVPSTFAFGFVLPRYGWLWALIIGSGVPVAAFIAFGIGYVAPCHPGIVCPPPSAARAAQGFIALIPAFLGACTGVFLRWMVSLTGAATTANK